MRLSGFFFNGPGFDGNHNDFPGHDEAAETDGDVESEHSIEIVPDHYVHDIGGLLSLICFFSQVCRFTYTEHKDQTTGNQAKSTNQLRWWASRKIRSWRADISQHIGGTTSHRSTGEKRTPLFVDHCRDHLLLMVSAHHHAKEENDQCRHRVERNARWLFVFVG